MKGDLCKFPPLPCAESLAVWPELPESGGLLSLSGLSTQGPGLRNWFRKTFLAHSAPAHRDGI